ncbi:winged helix-turn-helix domain-containing protein [Nakamurella deserti]|uniref:winged helix-turn-helix domain-containing protein n=1 Tax=Nakamurella deserti TaxID=2164074 RepID=UPI000DBE1B91|nr:helix-turn-helix domain-containing protein [Nakamurella deserti]
MTQRERPESVHDPRVLRAIAHPVRVRVLDELGATGPSRAADIARLLGIPANQASFHLRQLAKYGLVVEAPEQARDGRDRVWRATHDEGLTVDIEQLSAAPGGAAAVRVFRREAAATAHEAVDRAYGMSHDPEGRTVISDSVLRLTRADATAFMAELTALVTTWQRRGRAAGADARTYQLLQILQPARDVGAAEGS